MKNRLLSTFCLIAALGLASPALGFEVLEAKTEAQIAARSPITPIQLSFRAQLENNGFSNLPDVDVLIGWQKFGGIQPQPMQVSIPAGCFVPNNGFHVADFRGCGVEVSFDPDGRGGAAMSIVDFEARLKTLRDGTARFDVEMSFTDNGRESAILSALGGEAVEIVIGAESATAVLLGIEAVSGIEPLPF